MTNMDQLVSALRKLPEEDLRGRLRLVRMDGRRSLARYMNLPVYKPGDRSLATGSWYPKSKICGRDLTESIVKSLRRGVEIHKDLLSLAEGLSDDGFL